LGCFATYMSFGCGESYLSSTHHSTTTRCKAPLVMCSMRHLYSACGHVSWYGVRVGCKARVRLRVAALRAHVRTSLASRRRLQTDHYHIQLVHDSHHVDHGARSMSASSILPRELNTAILSYVCCLLPDHRSAHTPSGCNICITCLS
jgi:hypothetical protein